MIARTHEGYAGLWPQLEDLVPGELPPEVALARLVALARSLLIENRQLRDALGQPGLNFAGDLAPGDRPAP